MGPTMRTALLFAALAAAGCAQPPAQPTAAVNPDAVSLAAAETAFAAHSVREDLRAAFLAAFAEDGVFVRNGWANSNEYQRSAAAPPIVLDWQPVYAEVAASGELGLSTGPWKITSKEKPDAAPSYGQFVSVWRREAGGPWKVAVDLGIGHPEPTFWDRTLETAAGSGESASASRGIEAAELDFVSDAHAQSPRSAYTRHGSERMRFYRGGIAPAIGKAAALASPAMTDEKFSWVIDRTEIARSRDFGYARGSYASLATPTKPLGYFLRVWRMERGQWRIVMDVTNAAPKT
jgi:ketosteroid isomerase-like protein